ncbi:MAG: DUF3772 domain-containing protein [Pseudomonadota bacterium]
MVSSSLALRRISVHAPKVFNAVSVMLVALTLVWTATIQTEAQPAQSQQSQVAETDQTIEGWRIELDQIERTVNRDSITISELLKWRERLTVINREAIALSESILPQVESLRSRLRALTEPTAAAQTSQPAEETPPTEETPPADAATEGETQEEPAATDQAPAVENGQSASPIGDQRLIQQKQAAQDALTRQRTEIETQLSVLNTRLARTEVIVLRSGELLTDVKTLRRQKFTSRLFGRSNSIFDPELWVTGIQEVPFLLKGFANLISDGVRRVVREAPAFLAASSLLSALAVLLILTKFRPLRLKAVDQGGHINPFHRELNGVKRVLRTLIAWLTVPAAVLFTLQQAGELSPRFSTFCWSLLESLFYFTLARGLSLAIFSPRNASLRLVGFSDNQARSFHRTIVSCLTIALLGALALSLARAMVATLDVSWLIYSLTGMSFAATAFVTRWGNNKSISGQSILVPQVLILRIIGALVLVSLLFAFFAPLAGYGFLAQFSVNQVVLGGIISGILYLAFRLVDTFDTAQVTGASEAGAPGTAGLGEVGTARVTQFLLLFNGAVKVALSLVGVFIFFASWGLDTVGISQDLAGMFSEIRIGELRISPATLLMAVVLLGIGVLVTRALQRWLSNRFLPTTSLDIGLRNSITTAVGYAGFVIAAMIAFSQAGLDLSNLAIVAGALSLGIGFGLQSIVSNFVSGIILLAERPIKAGDWIEVGGEQGTVRKISVRSTEIETFDKATVIVPNADFISGSVKNMMYGNTMGRFIIPIGVGYDSDPDQIKDILLESAKNHPLVLAYPAPFVIFTNFGASSLDFELRGYLADCFNGLSVSSDLRFAILKRFREENIEIPFPQRVVEVKGSATVPIDGLAEALEDKARAGGGTVTRPQRQERIDADELEGAEGSR